jgi:hypothetical protein
MHMPKSPFIGALAGAILLAGLAGPVAHLAAQEQTATLIVLDRDALDPGPPPHAIPAEAVNDLIATVGLRDQLPYFRTNAGLPLTLRGGQNGNDGWFALTSVPATWASESGADDGLQNYALAGPGLGSPDANGSRDSQLTFVPDVQPLRKAGLKLLVGGAVCAVVYDEDVKTIDGPAPVANLSGANLGVIAFQVLSIDDSDGSEWPQVQVRILDAKQVCGGALSTLSQAPSTATP